MRLCLSCWDQAMSRSASQGSRPCLEPSTTRPSTMCMWRRWICASSMSCSVRRRCCNERGPSDQNGVDGEPERTASADDARVLRAGRAPGRERDSQLRAIPAAVDRAGVHLPTMRECFEQAAHQAEKETLSYEQYLLQLTERECESRRRNRIPALLRESGLPREKTMPNFDLKRLPIKAGRQLKALVD